MSGHCFLISYLLDERAGSCELRSDQPACSAEQASRYVEGLCRAEPGTVRGVQVQAMPGTVQARPHPASHCAAPRCGGA